MALDFLNEHELLYPIRKAFHRLVAINRSQVYTDVEPYSRTQAKRWHYK